MPASRVRGLAGGGGLLTGLVCQVFQTGLEVEMADHLGCERHAPSGRGSGSSPGGSSLKRVATEIGESGFRVLSGQTGMMGWEPVATEIGEIGFRVLSGQTGMMGWEPVATEIGESGFRVLRDRAGTFEPVAVPEHQRRLDGLSGSVILFCAKGPATGEIQARLGEVHDASVSREAISEITDEIVSDVAGWQNRPLEPVYAVLLIDAITVKVRDAQGR